MVKIEEMQNRILIVDDEEEICSVLAQKLFKEGYICITATNAKKGLNHLYRESFSLIITDIKMPEMDGMEFLKNVRAMNPNIMVIMMTGFPEVDRVVEAMRLGACDFILKPIDLDIVVLGVKKALEKKSLEEI
jgi:two-component system nitrogen regulation response regulator NtrX